MAKKAKGAKGKRAAKAPKVKRTPQDAALPGMEDSAITEIESLAHDYADVRDARQELTAKEVALKTRLTSAMKKHHKTTYKRGTIEVNLIVEEETVKVKIAKDNKA